MDEENFYYKDLSLDNNEIPPYPITIITCEENTSFFNH